MTEFQGRKALISGATRGIGKAIATSFLEAGATVIGIYGSNHKAADSFFREWEKNAFFEKNRLCIKSAKGRLSEMACWYCIGATRTVSGRFSVPYN